MELRRRADEKEAHMQAILRQHEVDRAAQVAEFRKHEAEKLKRLAGFR
jgi:hypothetical protein